MRKNKRYPDQMQTRFFSEVEKALRAGMEGVVLCLPGLGHRRRKLVAMHLVGDELFFFDPRLNPERSYQADLGVPGSVTPADLELPARRYVGNGMHALPRRYLADLFSRREAYAMLPLSFKLIA